MYFIRATARMGGNICVAASTAAEALEATLTLIDDRFVTAIFDERGREHMLEDIELAAEHEGPVGHLSPSTLPVSST